MVYFSFGLEDCDKDGVLLLKHPHDFVRPFLSDAARTIVSFPQSHTHLQQLNRWPLFLSTLSSARLITVNLEKRCPVKSVN